MSDFKKELVDAPGSTLEAALDMVRKLIAQVENDQEQLTRWQQIAIEEKAKQMNGPCDFRTKYEWCDDRQASCDGFPHVWECCPNKDRWRSEAAKELDLQMTQDTGYVERLEDEYLVAKKRLIAFHYRCKPGENMQDAVDQMAQAALDKIRGDRTASLHCPHCGKDTLVQIYSGNVVFVCPTPGCGKVTKYEIREGGP